MPSETNILDEIKKLERLRLSHLGALHYLIEYRESDVFSPTLKKITGRDNSFFGTRFIYIFVRPYIDGLDEDPLTVVQTIYKLYGIETKKHTTNLDNIEREILYVVQPYDQLSDEQRKFLDESCSSKPTIMNTISKVITEQIHKQPENNFSFPNPGINR